MKCWLCDRDALQFPPKKKDDPPVQLVYCRAHCAELHRTYEACLKDDCVDWWFTHYNDHILRHFRVANGCLQAPIPEGMVGTPPQNAGPSERE